MNVTDDERRVTPDLTDAHREQLAALANRLDTLADQVGPAWRQLTIGRIPVHENEAGYDRWRWMVSHRWEPTDNSPRGAAARIRYLLEHGLPENWREQMSGEKPVCYELADIADGLNAACD